MLDFVSADFIFGWVTIWVVAGGASGLYLSLRPATEAARVARWAVLPGAWIAIWTFGGWSFQNDLIEGLSGSVKIFVVLLFFSATAVWVYKKASDMSDWKQQIARALACLYFVGQTGMLLPLWFGMLVFTDQPRGLEIASGHLLGAYHYRVHSTGFAFTSDFITTRVVAVPQWAPFLEREMASSTVKGIYKWPIEPELSVEGVPGQHGNAVLLRYREEVIDRVEY